MTNSDLNTKKSNFAQTLFEYAEIFAISLILVILTITFVVRHSPVVGSSMYPTLEQNDILLISNIGYTPKQGDIIVCQAPKLGYDEPIVKRVIATEGQEINIDFSTWTVVVDGKKLDEDYINYIEGKQMLNPYNGMSYPVTVPEGCIFVMGDNRNGSKDSRDLVIGFVDERHVIGRVICRIFPFDKITLF